MLTHEQFVHRVRDLAVARLPEGEDKTRLETAKLVYGLGAPGLRGVTVFGTWQNGTKHTDGTPKPEDFIEVCAAGEENRVQLAGTTVHELAHCLAGHKAGHSKEWKDACAKLGLRNAMAAGHRYHMAGFEPKLREQIAGLDIVDGKPAFGLLGTGGILIPVKPRPCSLGYGTRGGRSRGRGSGSRQRKWVCQCAPRPQIVRAATNDLRAHCDVCHCAFTRAD